MKTMNVAAIKIGTRHRKDMGDIEALARSIREVGLLHPIVVRKDGALIAGERRLKAYEMLGMGNIDVTVVDIAQIARGEHAENVERKDFTLSEAVAIARALEPEHKAAAKERKKQGGRAGGQASGKLPQASVGKTRDIVAKATGKGARTLEKARDIVEAAEAEPEKFSKLQDDMDRTGNANGPHKRLKVMRQAVAIRSEPPPLPGKGPYRVIVADPPWPYEKRDEDPTHRGALPYTTMSIDDICLTNVKGISAPDCVLWLWVTNHHMREAFQVLDAWGFQQKTILTWVKDKMGMGDWLRGKTEHCLLAVRGKPIIEIKNHTTVLLGKVRKHSQKPSEFYEMIESHSPAPRYAYLWSRSERDKWDCHGDEVPS